jgi:glutathione S-transferase
MRGLFCAPGLRHISGAVMGMILTQRFAFHRSESLGLYEALERYLLDLAAALEQREFVVGEFFSAADLSLAALLRPLTIVPFFAEHPGLQQIFARHRSVLGRLGARPEFAYQEAIRKARTLRSPVRRVLWTRDNAVPFLPQGNSAANDQQRLWTRQTIAIPLHYAFTLRRNKVRQFEATEQVR